MERDEKGRFIKGHKGYRGLKGIHLSPKTEFKKGHKTNLGRKYSKETIEKMRKIKIGYNPWKLFRNPEETKKKISKNCGMHRKEVRKKNSESKKKLIKEGKWHPPIMKGKNHPNWQDGKSFEPYGLEFNRKLKEQIRGRDNYTCQECGFTQKQLRRKLDVHHIDFNKKNNNPNNLISLCRSCHTQTEFARENWVEYFENKVVLNE